MLVGIIVGASFATEANLRVIIVTMVTTSLALGISTGVSVFEAESLEQERKISELERALFRGLSGTKIEKSSKSIIMLAALINFLTPPFSCAVTISPFVLAALNIVEVDVASWISVTLAFIILFIAGVYMGRLGKKNPWIKGLRMVGFGLAAFIIGVLLDTLV
jgi:predicted membrane protein (TIGR00267 family)